MKFGSVCSGIEAASVAWNPLGWKAQWLAEIEPFPCSVLKHHHPDTPNLGDMTKYNDWPTDDKHAIDLLCGGTPCQSFSVAGLRKGLDDPRGNLMLTFGAIAAKYRPQWLVWENVPGVLSSNGGRDFGSFLGMLGQLGYGFAYRVLDAQYFGVAQRRRRVFVVGCFGDWRSAAAVLFERHSLQGHPAPRRQTREEVAQPVAECLRAGGNGTGGDRPPGTDADTAATYLIPVATLCVATGQAGAEIAPTLNCNHEAPYAMYQTAHTLRGEGFDASEDGTGRGTPLVPVSFGLIGNSEYADRPAQLRASGGDCGGGSEHLIAFPERMSGTQCASTVDLAPSMGALNPTAIAFQPGNLSRGCGSAPNTEVFLTLAASHGRGASDQDPHVAVAVSLRGREGGATAELSDEVGNCLRASGGGGDKAHVLNAMAVRRLTPRECERLQGFSDDYTLIPGKRKNIRPEKLDHDYIKYLARGGVMTFEQCCNAAADGPRYKALGNSWAVPNVRWIGRRIDAVTLIHKARPSTKPVAELQAA